jgi:hypothetical protein
MALQGSAVRIRLAPLVGEPNKSVTRKAFGSSEQFLKVFCAVNKHQNHGPLRVVWVNKKAGAAEYLCPCDHQTKSLCGVLVR